MNGSFGSKKKFGVDQLLINEWIVLNEKDQLLYEGSGDCILSLSYDRNYKLIELGVKSTLP